MQAMCCKLGRAAALVIAVITGLASIAWAGGRWKVGDVIVCFGDGTCQVVRPLPAPLTVLDTIGDGTSFSPAGPISNPGNTFGVAINNSLHFLVTDAGTSSNQANLVEYQIAGMDPLGNLVSHGVATVFNSGGAGNIQAVALDNAGDMFILNANGSSPQIVKLNQAGTPQSTIQLNNPPACNITQVTSMDLSADGASAYVTFGGTIQKVNLSSGSCSEFANFGSNVNLYGIKDIPPGALANVSPNCNGATCPGDETLLVVAKGYIDANGNTSLDGDAFDICNNATNQVLVSCGLLLDTSGNPGFPNDLWVPNNLYGAMPFSILDQKEQVQTVYTEGTSGGDEPPFNDTMPLGKAIDYAVIWTNEGQPAWVANNMYSKASALPTPGTYIVDPNHNLETVTTAGTSGPTEPGVAPNPAVWSTTGGQTIDGLVWQDDGEWLPSHPYSTVGTPVGDSSGHVHEVLTVGVSGTGPSMPFPNWNDTGLTNGGLTPPGVTIDHAVIWKNEGAVVPYVAGKCYGLGCTPSAGTYTTSNAGGYVQQVYQPGTAGGGAVFSTVTGGMTFDNAVGWADLGLASWLANFSYGLNAIIVDQNGSGDVQLVTTAGTSGPTPPTFNDSQGSLVTDGLQWMLVTPDATEGQYPDWQANTFYCSCPGGTAPFFQYAPTGDIWQAVTFGTSGATEPTFYAGDHVTPINPQPIADNAVVWTDQGPLSGSTFQWTANNPYALNAEIVDGKNHLELAAVPGTSGPGSHPSFSDGTNTADNGVKWSNLGLAAWRASFNYGLNAIIFDPVTNDVQQVTMAGKTGGSLPTFASTQGNSIIDGGAGGVTWTNVGPLSGFTWVKNNPYSQNAMIIDNANQVELATTAGMSGAGPNPPTFSDSLVVNELGLGVGVVDGLVWQDIGPTTTWAANTGFSAGALVVDPNSFLQEVTTGGWSGASSGGVPVGGWNESVLSGTVDGLQWSDQGSSVWAANTPYSIGKIISDPATHAQQVIEAGTTAMTGPAGGPSTSFGPWNDSGSTTIDNASIWIESHPNWAPGTYTVGNPNTLILDTNNNVELVTNDNLPNKINSPTGTTGPSQPSAAGHNPWNMTATGQTVDGLQWQNTTATSSVVARYPVAGQPPTLQALALNPLIRNCTVVASCSPNLASPTVSTFWMADSASGNFFNLDFATGTPLEYSTTIPAGCAGCNGIQGIGIYGAEGALQPALAQLPGASLTTTSSTTTTNAAPFNFNPNPSKATDNNSITITGYNFPNSSNLPLTVYASAINPASGASDNPLITLSPPPNPPRMAPSAPCTVMTSTGVCEVWQVDHTDLTGPPCTTNTCEYLWVDFSLPNVPNAPDANNVIDVIDEQYDDTYSLDGAPKRQSQVSLHTITPSVQGSGNCTYGPPLAPNTSSPPVDISASKGNITFKFTCTNLPPGKTQANLLPYLRLVQFTAANGFIPPEEPFLFLQGTGGTVNYRYDSTGQQWVFNLQNPMFGFTPKAKLAQYQACTEDANHIVETFCTNFYVK